MTRAKKRFTINGVKCRYCGTMLHMGSHEMPPVPIEVPFGMEIDGTRFPTDYMDSPNAEIHTLDRCRWQQAMNKSEDLHTEIATLQKLVIEIAHHFDPVFGYIDLHRLDHREWMSKAAAAVGRDVVYPWEKADLKGIDQKNKRTNSKKRSKERRRR